MSKQNSHRYKKHHKETLIIEFCLLIKAFFPQEIITIHTENKYKNLLESLEVEQQKLIEILIHHLTKLYQNHRVITGNSVIEIAEEDVLTALKIIENLELNTQNNQPNLTKKQRTNYTKIRQHFKSNLFTCKELQSILGLSKTQTNEFLHTLLDYKLLEKYGFKNKGYYYKLLEVKSLEVEELKETKLEDEILEEFSDNNHFYKNEF